MQLDEELRNVIHELTIVASNNQSKSDEKRLRKVIELLENTVEHTSSREPLEYFQPEV
ncbi:hypothetical protein [Bacillus suaedae]|uniref:Uncharacterized protein n=1 Tax=Halalkalibacter suaedae TaxID=2822140 RepID=A0A940WZF1_9BACI|nr:hypothetical protein [Bacillus suaedae]MBP3950964.1 hypothetical protein [Bacillus suaedae]